MEKSYQCMECCKRLLEEIVYLHFYVPAYRKLAEAFVCG